MGTRRVPINTRVTATGTRRATIARDARQILRTAMGPLSAATVANRTFARIEGMYHRYSAKELATDTWPTASTPSIGPNIHASQRTSRSESTTVTHARDPPTYD